MIVIPVVKVVKIWEREKVLSENIFVNYFFRLINPNSVQFNELIKVHIYEKLEINASLVSF